MFRPLRGATALPGWDEVNVLQGSLTSLVAALSRLQCTGGTRAEEETGVVSPHWCSGVINSSQFQHFTSADGGNIVGWQLVLAISPFPDSSQKSVASVEVSVFTSITTLTAFAANITGSAAW